MNIELAEEFRGKFGGSDGFDKIMALQGEVYRAKEGRRTILYKHDGLEYFIKIHHGIGWGEIFKNLSSFRLPVTSASNEWKAVDLLEKLNIATVKIVGKGVRGMNPAKLQSFVIMKALDERVEVEDFLKEMGGLKASQRIALKRAIFRSVADTARLMHGAGMNHRDFYLCHFHILDRDWSEWQKGDPIRLPLIDLHRAQLRAQVTDRWLAKDLGALLFSAIDCGITDRDLVAFLKIYLGEDWKNDLRVRLGFWKKVIARAEKFYTRHRNKKMVMPGVFSRLW